MGSSSGQVTGYHVLTMFILLFVSSATYGTILCYILGSTLHHFFSGGRKGVLLDNGSSLHFSHWLLRHVAGSREVELVQDE